jgi:hypothetical protein
MKEREEAILGMIESTVHSTAKYNGWEDFYNYHIKVVVECTEKIFDLNLPQFVGADRFTTIAGAWLHDIALVNVPECNTHGTHHTKGYKAAKDILLKHDVDIEKAEIIAQCVLRHRNTEEYPAVTKEQKIIAAADSMSHFKSIVYFTYHFYNPGKSLADMVEYSLGKLERDWQDISIIPEIAESCRGEYEVLKRLFESYLK